LAVRLSFAALTASLAVLFLAVAVPGWASCGSENCPVDHASRWDEAALSFDVSEQYIDQNQPRVGTDDAVVGQIPSHEDEVRTVNRITTARASYRFSGAWGLTMALPFVDRDHEHIHNDLGGAEYQRWSYSGVGDLETVALRRFGASGRTRYLVSAGVKAPTGVKNVEEVDGDQPEPPARPGTGSWDVLGGVGAEWLVHVGGLGGESGIPLRMSINGRYNGRGTEEYQVGAEGMAHIATEVPVTSWGSLTLQTNLRVRGKDNVGNTDVNEENTGGTTAYVTPGFRLAMGRQAWVYGMVQFPVYQNVNGIQIVSEANWFGGVTYAVMP
jgi:hypothetical protein